MNLSKHFLKKDVEKAEERIHFMKYCLKRAYEMLIQEEIDLSELWVDEYKKCVNDVKEMIHRKKFYDYEQNKLKNLMEDLKKRGVSAEIVIRNLDSGFYD